MGKCSRVEAPTYRFMSPAVVLPGSPSGSKGDQEAFREQSDPSDMSTGLKRTRTILIGELSVPSAGSGSCAPLAPPCQTGSSGHRGLRIFFFYAHDLRAESVIQLCQTCSTHHPLHQASGFVSVCGSVNASNEVPSSRGRAAELK